MARRLAATVFVRDPETGARLILRKGTSPSEAHAALVRNPHAWADESAPAPRDEVAPAPEVRVVVTPIPGDRAGYEALTVEDLEAIADARVVDVGSAVDGAELVEALLAHDDVLWAELAELGGADDAEAAAKAEAERAEAERVESARVEQERVDAEAAAKKQAEADEQAKAAAQAEADADKEQAAVKTPKKRTSDGAGS